MFRRSREKIGDCEQSNFAKDRLFCLMTSMNQKLQKPKSRVTLDLTQRKTRHYIAQTVQLKRALSIFTSTDKAFQHLTL